MKLGSSKKTARVKTRRAAKAQADRSVALRKFLRPLTDCCPVDHGNPKDCPLHDVRELTSVKRTSWLLALPSEDVRSLAAYHYLCSKTHGDR